ncbi:MAG: hypothetical protein D6744_09675 [Planctomycetota bacterium]|nr:MAG: hypothetical protein D6744_09675 [Planctomycetota bacterium]
MPEHATPARADLRVFSPAAVALCVALVASPAVRAQMGMTVIQDAHVLVGDGEEIESTSITLRGDKIMGVGRAPSGPMALLAKKIPAEGKYVTPGLIDVWCDLASRGAARSGAATALAEDNFDRFAESELRAALRNGVTAVYLPPSGGDGITGLGAVMRLLPGGEPDVVTLRSRAALASRVGADGSSGPLRRVQTAESLRKAFADALAYREALDQYEEDLKEYEKKLKEYVENWEKKQGKDDDQGEKAESKPAKEKGGGSGDDQRTPRRRRRPRSSGDFTDVEGADPPASAGAFAPNGGGEGEGRKERSGDKKKKDDAPKKPERPERDPEKETLLDVIDGKLYWRVEAYRPADILNVLEIAQEFNLALVLEGATGAHRLSDRLAEAGVKVISDARPPSVMYAGGVQRDRSPDNVGRLHAAGVAVYLGSGRGVGGAPVTPHLMAIAAQAVAEGLDQATALKRITGDAAELLGIDESVGRIASGMDADLVIWSDHPMSPGARVERVFVAGKEVYRAPERKGGAE